MVNIELFEKTMKEISDKEFNESIPKGALKLDDNQIQAVSFVFWLVYMAENDLNYVISEAWELTKQHKIGGEDAWAIVEGEIQEMLSGQKEYEDRLEKVVADLDETKRIEILGIVKDHYQKKRVANIEHLDYFIDKIRVIEGLYGKTARTKLFWKLNDLRNKISHNEINNLKYNGGDLRERSVREQLLLDYMRTAIETDFTKSEFWASLTKEEESKIKQKYQEIKKKMK